MSAADPRPAERRIPLLIVGGGIGGLAAALAIARTGRTVHLIEQAAELTEIGAGLQIGANATRVMDRLGILEAAEAVAVHPERAVMRDATTGETLTVLTLGDTYRRRYGVPYLVMHRGDLLQILLDACTANPLITLETRRHVTSCRVKPDGVTVTCEDGQVYRAELVVGADGLRSALRKLFVDDEPVCSGYVAYRGTMPIENVESDVDGNDVVLWIGPQLHLMQYPVRSGALYNQVAVFHSKTFAAGGGGSTPEELDDAFAPTVKPVRLSAASVSRIRHWPLYDREPLTSFVHGRLVLIGDAAHPMLQVLGQGACQALEDVVVLADQLAAHPDDLATALASYDQARVPRTTRCQRTARPWADVWHLTDPLAIALRNRIFRTRADDDYSDVDWLYAELPA
ncbi:FAD-dependent monooxygenase [Actinoplanes sp. NBRC 103695]|uniref:FAD-dependent monooxygenase n=1 Tax=Actinoplanes sp. NBRC 103695 TaxID=3032202 RepID=UPI0024A0477B|nr:FAD-dependent monooxygenase [Actinoplanes sp. NBRC 103695]GLY97220.1 salicylate hydroxylase [Actinoplanes sp. NBRC 103695]